MKILFFSPHTLADSSSGAAQSIANLLGELARLGHTCVAATGSVLDAKNDLFNKVLAAEPVTTFTLPQVNLAVPVRKVIMHGVVHLIATFKSGNTADVMSTEEVALYRLFTDSFQQLEPDVVLTYGGFISNYCAGLYAMSRGRKSVLYVASDTYSQSGNFTHANMIVTVSEAMSRLMDGVTALPRLVLPPFFDKAAVIAKERKPEYITLLNPLPAKGLMLAGALAVESARLGRPYKFLFVEGRGTRETMRALCPEVLALPNVGVAENTSDVKLIYQRSSLILFPSLWFETAGKVILEANANGIPVLASNIGGIPEMLGGAGYLFDPPQVCRDKWDARPPADYVAKWLEVIDRLYNEPAEMADAVKRAKEADKRYDLAKLAQKFVDFAGAQA
ncbi:MAG: glycosyltransferase family 4 protein [Rhodospirillaceae bacterium]|nr:glycosyltransferase family 4 protein [Rhodospirillaceae bacterium]